jgi:hypothetical protein
MSSGRFARVAGGMNAWLAFQSIDKKTRVVCDRGPLRRVGDRARLQQSISASVSPSSTTSSTELGQGKTS